MQRTPGILRDSMSCTFPYRLGGGTAAEFEVDITYEVYPGEPAQTYGPPERCHDGAPAEIHDISEIRIEVVGDDGRHRPAVPDEALERRIREWIESDNDLRERLIEHALFNAEPR